MSKVILFGCGRGAEVAHRHLKADSSHEVCGFTADATFCKEKTYRGLPLVPFEEVTKHFPTAEYKMLVLMGYQDMNHLRAEKYLAAKKKGYSFISYISSRAFSIEPIRAGENCFIMEGQYLNLDVTIGNNVVMWSGNHVGDKVVIGDHVWLSSHISIAGFSKVEAYSFVGVNAAISNHVTVAEETFVGASTLITQSTLERGVYVQAGAKSVGQNSREFLNILESARKI